MLQDLHAHTYYSFCGKDTPESIVEAAIAGGLELFGITDHNYGIGYGTHTAFVTGERLTGYGRPLHRYYDHLNLIREKYRGQITVLRGIELCTLSGSDFPKHALPDGEEISFFDYCLVENLDHPTSVTCGDIFSFAKRCGTPMTGIAHTDLFAHIANLGENPLDYFRRMAEANIFWEMNVSYDSIHGYRVHPYMQDFFADEEKQAIVREAGVRVSVGFDGHRVEDYLPERVADYCRLLTQKGIKMPFEDSGD